jgi:hypothetical protein
MREDVGKLVGMSVWLALEDLEEAAQELKGLGLKECRSCTPRLGRA